MSTLINAANVPLNQVNGSVPDTSGALQSYFQPMTFTQIVKSVVNFQVVETPTSINFWATIQPFTSRQLMLKPEGQRAWSWFTLYAEPGVILKVDDTVIYLGIQYRVMSKTNFSLYGYMLYELVQDYVGSGPG